MTDTVSALNTLVYVFSVISSLIFIRIPHHADVYKNTGIISLVQDAVFITLTVLYYENLQMIQIAEYIVNICRQVFFIKYYYEPNGMTDDVYWTRVFIVGSLSMLAYMIMSEMVKK
jgi:hypothetical protein